MAKPGRQYLTPAAKRDLIAVALMGAGHETWIAYPVAQAVVGLNCKGVRDRRAMAQAIKAALELEIAKREASQSVYSLASPEPTRGGLRLILGGRS